MKSDCPVCKHPEYYRYQESNPLPKEEIIEYGRGTTITVEHFICLRGRKHHRIIMTYIPNQQSII